MRRAVLAAFLSRSSTVLVWALTSTAMAGGQGCECDGHSIGLHISSSGRGSGSLVCLRVRHRPSLGPKLGRGRGRQANHSVCASQRQRHGAGDAARAGRRTGPRQYPGSHCQRDTLDVGSLTQKSSVGSKAPAVLPSSAPTLRHGLPCCRSLAQSRFPSRCRCDSRMPIPSRPCVASAARSVHTG